MKKFVENATEWVNKGKQWVPLVVVYISMFAMTAVSLWYSNYTAIESGRKFCDIIVTVNNAYKSGNEPITDLGKKLKQDYAELEKRLNC